MFDKILIANRGEIALRVLRACKELGIRTLVVYSQSDIDSLPVQLADEAICIGPGPAPDSYLRIDRIISAAEIGDVEAIHPGYGFLAENPHFAEVCESCNIKFIGPTSEQIRTMGDKAAAREMMKKAGVPVVPGSDGPVDDEKEAARIAAKIGFPVIVKAVAGGGGRGMRVVHNNASLNKAFHTARSEAERAFGNAAVYIEKFLENPRHVEIQILADSRGRVVHLGERDCSIQRRHQKLIEESPSPAVDADLRKRMGRAAVRAAESVGYVNVGTVEFILDAASKFYFMEMNTRIQVEHPVTEVVTGIDLVREQIRIAAGEPLGFDQRSVRLRGHALECRVNAEDAFNGFRPSPGRIEMFVPPGGPGVRVDTHVYSGYVVPSHYDSLLAKVITYGADRKLVLERMNRALDEFLIDGVKTTIPLEKMVINHPNFVHGRYSTNFVDEIMQSGLQAFI